MLGKLFSSSKKHQKPDEQLITKLLTALEQYRSDIFPYGVLKVAPSPEISQDDKQYVITLELPFVCQSECATLQDWLAQHCQVSVQISASYKVRSVRQHAVKGVGNIIAISSGKGGVGKSTTAVNLAYALIAEGAKVGILDADIYGPSIPTLLGLQNQQPGSHDGKTIEPMQANGVQAMSIGFLVDDAEATVWRGPMASRAFSQLLNETAWQDLDYLIVDMPPGTGDIQLTLAQSVPVAAAAIITTPQDIALIDAVKGVVMFEKVNVPVLGIIENMSYHLCENCGHRSHLFGQGGGEDIAEDFETKLLGQLPLDINIREDADLGHCTTVKNSSSEVAMLYRTIAGKISSSLYYQLDAASPETANIEQVEQL